MSRNEFIRQVKLGILNKYPQAEIYLFGSRARGDSKQNSDWDFIVITPKEKITYDYELGIRDPIYDIELETGEVISLLLYTKKVWEKRKNNTPLFLNVSNEGIKL